MSEEIFLVSVGLLVGMFSGLLGIGGGVLTVPALVFLPTLWQMQAYTIHNATGISAVQGLVAGTVSFWIHYRMKAVMVPMLFSLMTGSLIGSLGGGLISGIVSEKFLYGLFAFILLMTLIGSFGIPGSRALGVAGNKQEQRIPFWQGFSLGGFVGFFSAQIGIGGAVLLLPVLIFIKHVPVRYAIGTSAGLVVIISLGAVTGKAAMHLIPVPDALWVSAGGLFGGALGAGLSHRLSPSFLRILLILMILTAFLRTLWEIIK